MTRWVRHPALGSRACRKPVMTAEANTRILPSFFVAPGEYSTGFMVGEYMCEDASLTGITCWERVYSACVEPANLLVSCSSNQHVGIDWVRAPMIVLRPSAVGQRS